MRDYSNMPVLDWQAAKAPQKAKAQILHQEPVILQMPDDFRIDIESDAFGCKREADSNILYDCDGGELLQQVAQQTRMEGLKTVAEACTRSSSRVDIDRERHRIIVHD